MKRKLIIISSYILATFVVVILVCNLLVVKCSEGLCYDDIDAVPYSGSYGLLLGTGRSSAPSPYYDARVQAAIDLYNAGKIRGIIVSGENLYPDYNEVDSMCAAMKEAGVPVIHVDYDGVNTYTSLSNCKYESYTVISQHFQNQRAIYYGRFKMGVYPIAYDAEDTQIWYWNIWRFVRELLARTKAVLSLH